MERSFAHEIEKRVMAGDAVKESCPGRGPVHVHDGRESDGQGVPGGIEQLALPIFMSE